jgi:hypothetical protein
MRIQQQSNTHGSGSEHSGDRTDFSLEGIESVFPKIVGASRAAYFLDPIKTLHHRDFFASARVQPREAFEELFTALAAGSISACDLAESIVASRPSSVNEFQSFLKDKLTQEPVTRSRELSEAIRECLQDTDALILGHVQGEFSDALYRRSLESLIYYSGVLGELGKPGSINNQFYGPYCRRYDRVQVSVTDDGSLRLFGFSTESSQLGQVYDLITDLKKQGILRQGIGMSRDDFSRNYELSSGEIMKRGAFAAVGKQLGAVGVQVPSGDEYKITPNSSHEEVMKKILELTSVLHEDSLDKTVEGIFGPEAAKDLDGALEGLIPSDVSQERLEHFRWMLEELHNSLYLRYRARFHNEDKSIVSDDGALVFDVWVDHHREDYASILIDGRAVSADVYRIIFEQYVANQGA